MERVRLGRWTVEGIGSLLLKASKIDGAGERIDLISSRFLGIPYEEGTLKGSLETVEVFTINLAQVDCFTYLDYVEAMRLATTFEEFKKSLRRIRYRGGRVDFLRRNHFFTDWRAANGRFLSDVTREIGIDSARFVTKTLNRREDGTPFLQGIPECRRRLSYIPATFITKVTDRLKTGDYAGIYSEVQGLDVSHTGIIVRRNGRTLLRHASSLKKMVVEEELGPYLATKPGLIILRPRPG